MIASLVLLLAAADPSPTAPIDFLVGHCWVGKPKANQLDRHCFRRTADGTIVDHHEASEDGKVKVTGDTIYRWNASTNALQYTYRDSLGGVLSSTIVRTGTTIDFGTAPYRTKDGKSYKLHARWTVLSPTSYRTELTSPLLPFVKRTTLYNRAD